MKRAGRRLRSPGRRGAGFTLLEVIAVAAILAILAGLALPQYAAHVVRSRLLEAFVLLSDHGTRMEQYFLDRRTYTDETGNCGVPPPPSALPAGAFRVSCAATSRTFVYTAAGVPGKGAEGFVYTIDESGAHATVSVPTGWRRSADCWTFRRDGSCV